MVELVISWSRYRIHSRSRQSTTFWLGNPLPSSTKPIIRSIFEMNDPLGAGGVKVLLCCRQYISETMTAMEDMVRTRALSMYSMSPWYRSGLFAAVGMLLGSDAA